MFIFIDNQKEYYIKSIKYFDNFHIHKFVIIEVLDSYRISGLNYFQCFYLLTYLINRKLMSFLECNKIFSPSLKTL